MFKLNFFWKKLLGEVILTRNKLLKLPTYFFCRPVVENPESDVTDEPLMESGGPDGVDARIETFLRDWHHSPDLLFSIHPIDGSFLIW